MCVVHGAPSSPEEETNDSGDGHGTGPGNVRGGGIGRGWRSSDELSTWLDEERA